MDRLSLIESLKSFIRRKKVHRILVSGSRHDLFSNHFHTVSPSYIPQGAGKRSRLLLAIILLNLYFKNIDHSFKLKEEAVEEQVEIFGDDWREPTMKDLHAMTFLEMIIKESLRLFPSVPYFSRTVSQDVVLSECYLLRFICCMISNYGSYLAL